MPRYHNHRKTNRYTNEFKAKAVQLSLMAGAQVQEVAKTLDIHPFMLSRWRKEYREGRIVPDKRRKVDVRRKPTAAMASAKFAYIWQYFVEDSHRDEFLEAYGPNGDWVQLFSNDPAYVETRLLHDTDDDGRYVTIDYWVSRSARDSFREKYSREFSTLDEKCEQLTTKEQFLGDFVLVDDSTA